MANNNHYNLDLNSLLLDKSVNLEISLSEINWNSLSIDNKSNIINDIEEHHNVLLNNHLIDNQTNFSNKF